MSLWLHDHSHLAVNLPICRIPKGRAFNLAVAAQNLQRDLKP